jgi:coenzyme F420-dependent glucose-6-phosphate dehydrogenase
MEIVERFEQGGGKGKPRYGQLTGCWAASREDALKTAMEIWPNAGIQGAASPELPLPEHFEQLAQALEPEELEFAKRELLPKASS